jgi:hypothetical protein
MSSDDKKPTVTPMPNGPYVVKDLPALANQKGPIEVFAPTPPAVRRVCQPSSSTARNRGSMQPVRPRKRSPKSSTDALRVLEAHRR